ncbi:MULTISPECIES: flavin reductase family protein [Pseudomonadota]|jgi:flavin reductase (DIM6/NTAB) family NADH-FMN oxidoreductase RutF|uniref:Flavin reductase n=1 Tax=Stutzerimonas zhaodongensis TaxID=1176257 RepID=A0A365PNT4_9GAMM|nr:MULTISPECIES: flavin reductase family protein [Pseudomonadota]EED7004315.1 flavin reductase family protein [Salmonella enterica subsp. enterica serovar Braenderup]EKY1504076.1 flavin reductase family protein [Enterobacter cloacae]QGL85432.1 flavin reductase family protein [Stenotrophomonas maltophilia]QXW28628.1 flavin reductase family protein [Aeromonas sanarellii]RBA51572.1 flavin reductase [Stutzerimonas zhaodongensis]HAG79371.1 flavin reductase [Pseudomonas sp.]|tara:strand:- start:905 stop:1423 length:519 start_codon:yes stop_codon:yes gene_type:complete
MIERTYMSQHPLIAAQLRQAMRGVASTVTLITSIAPDGHGHVMIASSFTSVSLEPPTVLVCIGQQTRIHGPLLAARRFCINVLRAEQEVLAVHCRSATGTDRFDHEAWRFDEVNGLPYLQGAQASLFCELIEHHAVGTHSVMLASVERVLTSAYADPLVYLDGRFRAIDPTR